MTWCDEYGGLYAYKYLHHTFVTYKIEKIYFTKPGKEGDLIDFYMDHLKFNNISVTFDLLAVNNADGSEIIRTSMTFVAIDRNTEKATRLNPLLFERHEFEAFAKQHIKVPKGVEVPQINVPGKGGDLLIYKRNFIKELYLQTYNEDVARAITVFQKDYCKLIPATSISEIISVMNPTPKINKEVEHGENQ